MIEEYMQFKVEDERLKVRPRKGWRNGIKEVLSQRSKNISRKAKGTCGTEWVEMMWSAVLNKSMWCHKPGDMYLE